MGVIEIMGEARRRSALVERQVARAPRAKAGIGLDSLVAGASPSMLTAATRRARNDEAYHYFRHWNYVCIAAIARRLSGQPFLAGFNPEGEEAEDTVERRTLPNQKIFRKLRGGQTIVSRKASVVDRFKMPARLKEYPGAQEFEMLQQHSLLDALNRPNPVQRRPEFLFAYVANLMLTGESYIVGGENQDGQLELWAIPRTWITPEHKGKLFSGYVLRVSQDQLPMHLEPSQVVRVYIPDPADPKSCISPVATQITAIKTDEHIQNSQEHSFSKGILPNIAIKMGQRIDAEGKPSGARPVLTSAQRRQMIRSIRTVWNQTVGNGEPAILDGLIENVFKLDRSGREMDWIKSGESVKQRIFQAYGVNPYVVGEISGANRAQAVVAERNFCDNTVNPHGDALSEALTDFTRPHYPELPTLQVWVEPCRPTDEEMQLKRWELGLASGAADPDEFRAEILCLPPRPEEDDLLDDEPDDEPEEDPTELEEESDDEDVGDAIRRFRRRRRSLGKARKSIKSRRDAIRDGHVKQVGALEAGVADALQSFFR